MDFEDEQKGFYNFDDVVTEGDVIWAVKHQGIIFSNQPSELPKNKQMATLMLLQSISRMDYNSLNRIITWKDEEGNEHAGVYHPMDLLHQVVLHSSISSRSKLYKKLSMCKLAVPVCIMKKKLTYMNTSLHHVKISWFVGDKRKETGVTLASVPVVSVVRIGRMSKRFISKSELANDVLGFDHNARIGSCGFFTRKSAASNNRRKLSKGNIEGVWYEKFHGLDSFESSFTFLNLRGNALDHVDTSLKLASATDILILFCDRDMFKDDQYTRYLDDLKQKAKQENGNPVIKKIIIIFTKDCMENLRQCDQKISTICSNRSYQPFNDNYKELLERVVVEIQKSLKSDMGNKARHLNERFSEDSTTVMESAGTNIEETLDVSDSFINEMNKINEALKNSELRSEIRRNIFPLQSFTKVYAQTVRKECRSLDITEQRKLEGTAYEYRALQYKKISEGLPSIMSKFLKNLFKYEDSEHQMTFVRGVQDSLDDWCSQHLFQIKQNCRTAFKNLIASRDDERKIRKKTGVVDPVLKEKVKKEMQECENLNNLLLDLSVGMESIFREIGQICESTLRYESSLTVPELKRCTKKLPELAASLLLEGLALEVMDGDGLSCPTEWIQSVLIAVEEPFKFRMGITDRDPKVFALAILGTQSTGKSTLLNTMFGVQFPVSSGRCTKGAFLQLIPLRMKECTYDGIILIDTEGLGAPEYQDDKTHDNEIATFVLGISDLALINVTGELPLKIESFIEVSTAALMRMNNPICHRSAMFVHQNCDPSAKDKNDSAKDKFIKSMNDAVKCQAVDFQLQDMFHQFQDVVDISIANDFFYFPHFLSGKPPMVLPSPAYSNACWDLTSSILQKMNSIYNKHGETKTFRKFSEKVASVWDGILKESFVFSLVNSAEIQAKYAIGENISMVKYTMESQINDNINDLSNIIAAAFKSAANISDASEDKQKNKEKPAYITTYEKVLLDFEQDTNEILQKQKKLFLSFIAGQTNHKLMYQKWEQRCINELEEYKIKLKNHGDELLKQFCAHKLNEIKLSETINNSRAKVGKVARETASSLIFRKEEEAGNDDAVFTNEEINMEFDKFWETVQETFKTQKKSGFQSVDVVLTFRQVILSKYRQTPNFLRNVGPFGKNLENAFKNEWIRPEHLQFKSKSYKEKFYSFFRDNDSTWRNQIVEFIERVIGRVENDLLKLMVINDSTKMKFQDNSITLNFRALVSEYIVKVIGILEEEHEKEAETKAYKLTDQFKAVFSCYAAQKGILPFTQVQKSFIDKTDVSIEKEKENIRQLFTLLLKKEKKLTIAATLMTAVFQKNVTKNKPQKIRTEVYNLILSLLKHKAYVHGLVLCDVIAMVTSSIDNKESQLYLDLYFNNPFIMFEYKIKEVILANKNLNINSRLEKNIMSSFAELEKWLNGLVPSEEMTLVDLICAVPVAIKYGIGKSDFNTINVSEMPLKFDDKDLSEKEKEEAEERYKELNEKRMLDETEIILRLRDLISKTDFVDIEASRIEENIILSTLLNDVRDHLFQCQEKCPLCRAPCNETHSPNDENTLHECDCHRPQGFAGYTWEKGKVFITQSCNELVEGSQSFKDFSTGFIWVPYKSYKSVYKDTRWNITKCTTDQAKYWKYITHKVMDKLDQFYPNANKEDVSAWKNITKDECLNIIKRAFHLDPAALKIDTKTGRYILT